MPFMGICTKSQRHFATLRIPPLTGVPSVSSFYTMNNHIRDFFYGNSLPPTPSSPQKGARINLQKRLVHKPLIRFTAARNLELERRVDELEAKQAIMAPRLALTMGFVTFLYGVSAMTTLVLSDMAAILSGSGGMTNV